MVDQLGPERSVDQEVVVNINDLFWTFQGEGLHWGRRALFVRMPFCNLACPWCDTTFNSFNKVTEAEFKAFATQEPARFAVVTGGEPMMNKHTPQVVKMLKELGFTVACESNGTFPIVHGIDFVTVSPKRESNYVITHDARTKVHELKLVVDEGFDFAVADNFSDLPSCVLLTLSPEFGNFEKSIERITAYIKENPRWKISLQTHKWMNVK